LIFQEEGNPIFITDKKAANIIVKAIDENWKNRPKKQSFFENGLFYIFSYIAETVRKKSKLNRVIVITDTPSDLSSEYQEALYNLVSKIKHFPTFIDIIRVSEKEERFFKDDVKLNILASDTKGGIFFCTNKKEFLEILNKLVKNKRIISTFEDRPDQIKISTDDYAFYSRLAKKLKKPEEREKLTCYFCHEDICPVCTDINDSLLICEDCNTAFHHCCVINYTITHNIGIPHIFRCPNKECDVLLQISEDAITEVAIDDSQITSVSEYIGIVKGIEDSPKIISVEPLKPDNLSRDKLNVSIKKEKTPQIKENLIFTSKEKSKKPSKEFQKTMRIGGFFGKVFTVTKMGDKIIYERITQSIPKKTEIKSKKSEKKESWTSSNVKRTQILKICPICGINLKPSQQKKCPNCGSVF